MESSFQKYLALIFGGCVIIGFTFLLFYKIGSNVQNKFGGYPISPITASGGGLSQFPTGSTSTLTSTSGTPNMLDSGVYNSSPPTLSNGNVSALQLDLNGNLKVVEQQAPVYEDNTNGVAGIAVKPLANSTYSWSYFQSNAFTATNIATSSHNLFAYDCVNTSTVPYIVQFYDTSTSPTAGANAKFKFPIGANSDIHSSGNHFGANGINFINGIELTESTVTSTYVAGTAGAVGCEVLYK